MSLRGLINLRIVISVLIIIVLGATLAIWQARESVREEVTSSYNLALQLIEFGLSQFTRVELTKNESGSKNTPKQPTKRKEKKRE